MAVNSYDNGRHRKRPAGRGRVCTIRADDGKATVGPAHRAMRAVMRVYDRLVGPPMGLIHSLRGHRHQNWPIRSAFLRHSDGRAARRLRAPPPPGPSLAAHVQGAVPTADTRGGGAGDLGRVALDVH